MVHFSMFGGTETLLSPNLWMCVTIFAGTELKRPTMARQILNIKQRLRAGLPVEPRTAGFSLARFGGGQRSAVPRRSRCFCLTLFGATELQCPTLAEEFVDLKSLLGSEGITPDEWRVAMPLLAEEDGGVDFVTVTMFGGFGVEYPSRKEEVEKLEEHLELGLLSQSERDSLARLTSYAPKDARAMLRQMAEPQLVRGETIAG